MDLKATANGVHPGAAAHLTTFYVGESLCGLDILKVQEIDKPMVMTRVPQAPDYVKGILNLRGRIVTTIDLAKKLRLPPSAESDEMRNIIVNSQDEHIGLLVDRIGDVVDIDPGAVEAPPANIGEIQGTFFEGVFKREGSLIGILDLEAVLREVEEPPRDSYQP